MYLTANPHLISLMGLVKPFYFERSVLSRGLLKGRLIFPLDLGTKWDQNSISNRIL